VRPLSDESVEAVPATLFAGLPLGALSIQLEARKGNSTIGSCPEMAGAIHLLRFEKTNVRQRRAIRSVSVSVASGMNECPQEF
jgi:hypothetical protein